MKKPTYLQKQKALQSLPDFIELIQFHGGMKSFSKVHKDLMEFMMTNDLRKLILMPRGHLKSTIASVAYVLWRIYQDCDIRFMVGTADKKLSYSFVRELKTYLEDEELQELVWNNRPHIPGRLIPTMDSAASSRRRKVRNQYEELDFTEAEDKKVVWRSDAIQVLRKAIVKEPTVMASSVGTIMTGLHFDQCILDDIVTFRNSDTIDKCEKTLEWVRDIQSVLDPYNPETKRGNKLAVTGTRYALPDYYGWIQDRIEALGYKTFIHNIYSNGKNAEDGYLWPERFNEDIIQTLRVELGPRRFASQYMNTVLSDEERILDSASIQWFTTDQLEVKDGYVDVHLGGLKPKRVRPYVVIDPAISEKKSADDTMITVGGQDIDRNLFVFDVRHGKWLPNKTIQILFELCDKWKCKAVTVETVGFQASLLYAIKDQMRNYYPIVVREYKPREDKHGRIKETLEPLFANNKVYMVQWLSSKANLMEQINFMGKTTVHDEFPDTLDMLYKASKPMSVSSRTTIPHRRAVNELYGGFR